MNPRGGPDSFAQKISPTAVIKSILDGYPFGVGIFREILQNSDDAKASKQIFLLDKRHHASDAICHENLKNTQGPALIAFNDATFQESDWVALQSIYQSSKKMDTSKIGKYGIGFRSCYHITDYPQILSCDSFAMFDPENNFTDKGGIRLNLSETPIDHLRSMNLDWFGMSSGLPQSFAGTIVRLPLRTEKSDISEKLVTTEEIHQLLHKFMKNEIDIVLLFLSNLKSIDIYVINEHGGAPDHLASVVASQEKVHVVDGSEASSRNICVTLQNGVSRSRTWRILHMPFDTSECAKLFSERLREDATSVMQKEKLTPNISLAIASKPRNNFIPTEGRLFTYLPLPLPTKYPCHIHGLFALDQSRQYLRNSNEKGLVPGSSDFIRVEWNRFLFDTLIPRAWAQLLCSLIEHDSPTVQNIFHAWPQKCSDLSDWRCIPTKLLEETVSNKKAVWPIIPYSAGNAEIKYFSLEDIFVTQAPCIDQDLSDQLLALATVGLRIAQLPSHLYRLTIESTTARPLVPDMVRKALLEHAITLANLQNRERDLLLNYLLSSDRLEEIIDLPLLPLVDETVACLSLYSPSCPVHVLLEAEPHKLFATFDRSAISLAQLPALARKLLCQNSNHRLNVQLLSCEKVISYLYLAAKDYGLAPTPAQISPKAMEWLSCFWAWVGSWPSRKELYPLLESVPSLPTTKNSLQMPQDGIFLPDGFEPKLYKVLETVGVPFLHCAIDHAARGYLREHHSIKGVSSSQDFLEYVQPDMVASLSENDVRGLRDYLVASNANLKAAHRAKLQQLPIFPRLLPTSHGRCTATTSLESVADDLKIRCVADQAVLPLVPHTFYTSDLRLARLLDPDVQWLPHVEIFRLAIACFPSQPVELQLAFLTRIHDIRHEIPHNIINGLNCCVFVHAVDGILRPPADIFDPTWDVAKLLLEGDVRLPRRTTQMDESIVAAILKLGLFKKTFTISLARERIQFIAGCSLQSSDGIALAERLLDVMERHAMDYNALGDIVNLAWLPTNRGLRKPSECRDRRDEVLCKDVLPLLTGSREIQSPALRQAFGWNKRIPMPIVINQFRHILIDGDVRPHPMLEFHELISEFGSRPAELDDNAICELKRDTNNRLWVPTSGPCGLSLTEFAVFSLDYPLPIFWRIHTSLTNNCGAEAFLQRMGCTHRPSNDALLGAIQGTNGLSINQIRTLLTALQPDDFSASQRSLSFVPDSQGTLRAPSEIYFNDLGTNASRVLIPPKMFCANGGIHYDIAMHLHLAFLSHLATQVDDEEEEDMGEDLTTRISNVLRQYSEEQAISEFLANAADAKATEFNVYLDEHVRMTDQQLITPEMKQYERGPSLIIHNNGIFCDNDWKGIRRVGRGSKQGVDEHDVDCPIGRFGLGALSMFHFTEVAMIVSGTQVLFLDPAKRNIDGRKRSSRLISLANMKDLFPGHLTSLEGVFGFSLALTEYPGTIIKLPLRTEEQANQSLMSKDRRTAQDVHNLIRQFYDHLAPSALLFIRVNRLSAVRRSTQGIVFLIWSVTVPMRKPIVARCTDQATLEEVVIEHSAGSTGPVSDKWHVVVERIQRDSLSKNLLAVASKYRIKGITVGIAGPITVKTANSAPSKLFSGLPLPTTTSLPVHLHGSFILSDDRRSVRFDGRSESVYNRWLVSERIPSLYLQFIETWPSDRKLETSKWWPQLTPTDDISRSIVNSIKEYFPTSQNLICDTVAGPRASPSQCVFLPTSGNGVNKVMKLLHPPNLARYPPILIRSDILRQMDGRYVKEVIQTPQGRTAFCSLFSSRAISIPDVMDVVKFLRSSEERALLIGLPLLPLVSGDLALFTMQGASSNIYTWRSTWKPLPWHFFGSDQFLHPEVSDVDAQLLSKLGMNVSGLTEDAIVSFIKSRFPRKDELEMEVEDQQWIDGLWSIIQHVGVSRAAVQGFPLVQTLSLGPPQPTKRYVSIKRCAACDVLAAHILPSRLQSLQQMGVIFVDKQNCPSKLQGFLPDLQGSFEDLLSFFETLPDGQIGHRMSQLQSPGREALIEWIRKKLEAIVPARGKGICLNGTAKRLPVWEVIRANRGRFVPCFAAAQDILMLPYGVDLSIVKQFLPLTGTAGYSAYSPPLLTLQVPVQTMAWLQATLQIPPIMQPVSPKYIRLLEVLLNNRQRSDGNPIQVPNSNGRVVPSNTLYARTEPVFEAAFLTRQHNFLHPSLNSLESRLVAAGLRSEVDFASFLNAASAIHEDVDGPNRARRAEQVYDAYSTRLFGLIWGNANQWRQLENLRFIPRNALRRRVVLSPIPFQQYARALPEVVSPAELLRVTFEPVAWTQRALFNIEPSEQLSVSNPSLGRPTIGEVIQHLRVLSLNIAPRHRCNSQLVSDLRATYGWLNERVHEAQALLDNNQEPLFLNVDDPNTEWEWETATNLVFNAPDEGNRRCVRSFMASFRNLLLSVGAHEIRRVSAPTNVKLTPTEETLVGMRESFDRMRRDGKLTDVIFETGNGRELPAHRVFLAAQSNHFEAMFSGGYSEASTTLAPVTRIPKYVGFDPTSIEITLDYLYTGDIPGGLDYNKLVDALKISDYFGLKDFSTRIQLKIIDSDFITPGTYSFLLELSESVDLNGPLATSCLRYEIENRQELDMMGL